MASAENRSSTRARMARASSSPSRSTAAAVSSAEATIQPVTPSANSTTTRSMPP
jgi:hypothetical protein